MVILSLMKHMYVSMYVFLSVCTVVGGGGGWGGMCGVNPFTFLLDLMVEIGFVYVPLTSSKLKTLNHIFM